MNILIINANPFETSFDLELSELIYSIESMGINVVNIVLRNLNYNDVELIRVNKLIISSNLIIYATPITNNFVSPELVTFFLKYDFDRHPNIIILLEANADITTASIEIIVDYFEKFSKEHDSNIIDVQYLSDAKVKLLDLLNEI